MIPTSWVLNFWGSLKLVHGWTESPSGLLNAGTARREVLFIFSFVGIEHSFTSVVILKHEKEVKRPT